MGRRLSRNAEREIGMSANQKPVGIVGGLGKTGRRVAERLARAGHAVRPLSRSTEHAFDWENPGGWALALAGTSAAYVTFQPDLAAPHAAELIGRLGRIAAEEGLGRIVLLSGRGEPGALAAEQTLADAGVPWAVIRSSWFAQNFSESFLADAVASGRVVIPVGTAAEPFVDVDDIAETAVHLLTGPAQLNRVYEVTGPSALRFPEACVILAKATGRAIACDEFSVADFGTYLRATGLPHEVVPIFVELFTTTLDGRNSATANGVSEALGRAPRAFQDYATALNMSQQAAK